MFEKNDKQTVTLRSGSIKCKNHFKQLAAPFKIYADFESVLKGVRSSDRNNNTSYTEKYQAHIPCSFAYKIVCVDERFRIPGFLYRGKNAINRFILLFSNLAIWTLFFEAERFYSCYFYVIFEY